jgi:hypothetical protein
LGTGTELAPVTLGEGWGFGGVTAPALPAKFGTIAIATATQVKYTQNKLKFIFNVVVKLKLFANN